MQKQKSPVPFNGTAVQEKELRDYILSIKDMPGALMPALQKAQEIYGYLPLEVQKIVAMELNLPMSEVYGVVTFYSQFSLYPKSRYKISVCLGTACYVKGSGDILARIKEILGIEEGESTPDGLFTIEACRCIGACGLAPVITINGDVYGRLTVDDVDEIIEKYRNMQ